jgi:hypothetical protein
MEKESPKLPREPQRWLLSLRRIHTLQLANVEAASKAKVPAAGREVFGVQLRNRLFTIDQNHVRSATYPCVYPRKTKIET